MYNNQGYGQGYGNQGQGRGQVGFGGLGFVVKGVASGIGLASESIHARKEKKAAKKMAEEEAARHAEEAHHSQSQSPAPGPREQSDYGMPPTQGSRHQSDYGMPPTQSSGEQPGYGVPPAYEEKEEHHVRPEKEQLYSSDEKQPSHASGKGVHNGELEHEEGDEEQWDLDDAQDELIAREPIYPKNRPFERDPRKITQHFIDDYPIPQGMRPHGRLTLPVVLPQRRPKDRSRGFIRAYAPELMNAGIDQAMFLDFLETFNTASQASPWLNAINMAGLALLPLHLAPGIGQAATVALYLTVELMKNMQSRKRYNGFLDQINEQFYQPRGLYCMVLTWNPETDATEVGININETIHQNLTPPEGISKITHNYRPSMGATSGVAFTETAPLIFPALDKLDDSHSGEAKTKKEQLKAAMNFTGEYFDRRAQAKFAAQAPDSQLVVGPKPTFTSRYSDPNNPTNSGDMLALLTAGKLSMPNTGIGYSAAAGGAPRGLGGLGGMGGGFGGGRMGFGGGMGGMGGMGGGFGGMGGGFGRPMGGFGGGFGGGRMGMGGMGGMGGPIGGIMGLLGGMSGGGRMGGMGGMGGQQQMQEQMMLDQEQMMLNQQQMMMNQQQYPNQMGYNQQYATQMGGRMRGLDQTDNQQYPQQMGPMGPTQTRGIQTPNQIGGGMMGPQYPSQAMGSTQIGFGGTQLLTNGVKRILRHHVLYLLIVNMPTEEEMADATKFMQHVREAQKQGA